MDWQGNSQTQQGWYPNYQNYQGYNYAAGNPTFTPPQANAQWSGQPYSGYTAYPPPSGWSYGIPPNFQVPPPSVMSTNEAKSTPPLPKGLPPLPPDPPPGEPPMEKEAIPSEQIICTNTITDSEKNDPSKPAYAAPSPNFNIKPQCYNYSFMSHPPPTKSITKNDLPPIKFVLPTKNKVNKNSDAVGSKYSNLVISQQYNISQEKDQKNSLITKSKKSNTSKLNTIKSSSNDGPMDAKNWPPALGSYVTRCFDRCKTELDRDQVEICLKGKLVLATNSKILLTKDWDNEPLINIHSVDSPKPTKFASKNFKGDPSRGFSVKRKSVSRSPSPRRDRRRSSSGESSEVEFVPLTKQSRRGKGKKRGKGRGQKLNKQETTNPFYSKHGAAFVAEESFGSSVKLEKRAARFATIEAKSKQFTNLAKGIQSPSAKRRKKMMNLTHSINLAFEDENPSYDINSVHIVGTCTDIEKKYLRLTSAPDPSSVRNITTLKASLQNAKNQWKKKQDYRATCDRMKSIRQDLTVQGIRDQFTVQVYETHCRIALEGKDHEEYNQCQSQLKQLYSETGGNNLLEFTAYRLLYYVFTTNTQDITSLMASLSDTDKKHKCVAFALEVRAAWSQKNYCKFFALYKNAPLMSGYLMEWFTDRERKLAIQIIIKSYSPTVESNFVKSSLAIDSDEDWQTFALAVGLVFTDQSKHFINCKTTSIVV